MKTMYAAISMLSVNKQNILLNTSTIDDHLNKNYFYATF